MEKAHHRNAVRIWPTSLCVAVLLVAAAFAATGLQLLEGGIWQVPTSLFAVGAIVGLVCDARARATRRLRTALDLYAEREIARETTRKAAATLP